MSSVGRKIDYNNSNPNEVATKLVNAECYEGYANRSEENYMQTESVYNHSIVREEEENDYNLYSMTVDEPIKITQSQNNDENDNNDQENEVEREEKKEKFKTGVRVNSYGKPRLAAFVVVIVALIAIVCINAFAISKVAANVAVLESELSEQNDLLNSTNASLTEVSYPTPDSFLEGFVAPSEDNIVSIVVPEVDFSSDTEVPTNWFDSFCNLFS